jgi:hypothetical protein
LRGQRTIDRAGEKLQRLDLEPFYNHQPLM